MQLLPIRGLPIEHPLEAQMKTTPRPLIAVLSGGEYDAAVIGQDGLQQRGRNGGGLIHQQQIRLHIPLSRSVWRHIGQARQPLWRVCQRGRGMGKERGDGRLGGCRHHYLQAGILAQQIGAGQTQQRTLAAATIRAQHQRTTAMTMQHLVNGRQRTGLIGTEWPACVKRTPGLAAGGRTQGEGRIPCQQPHQAGDKTMTRQLGILRLGDQSQPVRIRVGWPRLSGGRQQQQQTTGAQRARQGAEGIGMKAAEGVEHQGIALLTQPL
ncbi:hypothetical protein D3C77_55690 [compost metagenome]